MAESYMLGEKTSELLARVIVLRELQQQGKLDTKHGQKAKLSEIFGIGPMALNRSLSAMKEIEPEVNRILALFGISVGTTETLSPYNEIQLMKQRIKELELDLLSQKRYEEMRANPDLAIPFETYQQMLAAEGLV